MPPGDNTTSQDDRVALARLEVAVNNLDRQVSEIKDDNDQDHAKLFNLLEKMDDKLGSAMTSIANLAGRFNGNPVAVSTAETKGKLSGLHRWLPYIVMMIWGIVIYLITHHA